jgi:hypothetical protein
MVFQFFKLLVTRKSLTRGKIAQTYRKRLSPWQYLANRRYYEAPRYVVFSALWNVLPVLSFSLAPCLWIKSVCALPLGPVATFRSRNKMHSTHLQFRVFDCFCVCVCVCLCVTVPAAVVLPAEKHQSIDKRPVTNVSAAEPSASAHTLQRDVEHRHWIKTPFSVQRNLRWSSTECS